MKIAAFEEHGEVLHHWVSEGWRNITLYYFDQHLDFKAISDDRLRKLKEAGADPVAVSRLNRPAGTRSGGEFSYGIDDFLRAAHHIGVVSRVIWFVPGHQTPRQLAEILLRNVKLIPEIGGSSRETFRVAPYGATCRVLGLEIVVTSIGMAHLIPYSEEETIKVDIDLDYFVVNDVFWLAPKTFYRMLQTFYSGPIHTLTYSISSGFLAERFRHIGAEIASLFGAELCHLSQGARTGPLRSEVDAILELIPTDLPGAERLAMERQQKGSDVTWPAYKLALAHLDRQNWTAARPWLELAAGDGLDTVNQHALYFLISVHIKLKRFAVAQDLLHKAIRETPLRRELYLLQLQVAISMGDETLVRKTSDQLRWFEVSFQV